MVRGEIYFTRLAPRSGSEQGGVRPCIIVSTNDFNQAAGWRSITVVPLTTSERWLKDSATTVLFENGEASLPKTCVALAHQITTIDKEKLLGERIGKISPGKERLLNKAIINYLNLDSEINWQ